VSIILLLQPFAQWSHINLAEHITVCQTIRSIPIILNLGPIAIGNHLSDTGNLRNCIMKDFGSCNSKRTDVTLTVILDLFFAVSLNTKNSRTFSGCLIDDHKSSCLNLVYGVYAYNMTVAELRTRIITSQDRMRSGLSIANMNTVSWFIKPRSYWYITIRIYAYAQAA